jgi:hypothetical protein
VDRAYGALGTYVASHALRVDGPVREYYLVGRRDTPDENAWRTEIGWPVFSTGAAAQTKDSRPRRGTGPGPSGRPQSGRVLCCDVCSQDDGYQRRVDLKLVAISNGATLIVVPASGYDTWTAQ